MAAALKYPKELENVKQQFGVFSDFTEDQLDALWVDTVSDLGTVAMGDSVGGIVVLTPSDGTVADNDEAYLACPNEIFKFAADKPMYAVASLQFTEANTDDANVGLFFQNAIGANSIIDDAGGLKVSGSTIGIYKVDGETVWRCVSANNSSSTVTVSTTSSTSSSYQKLEIETYPVSSTVIGVVFKVNDQYLKDTNGDEIKHKITVASSTEMQVGVGVKNGGGNNQTLNVDYLGAWQVR